jgi:hypothetical protein
MTPHTQSSTKNATKRRSIQKDTVAFVFLTCFITVFYVGLFVTSGLSAPSAVQFLYLLFAVGGIGFCLLGLLFGTSLFSAGNIRQLRQPSEFRISDIDPPKAVKFDVSTDANELSMAFETLQKSSSKNKGITTSRVSIKNDDVLFDLCTEIWRLKKKVSAEMQRGDLSESQIPRYIQRIDRALESANVIIHDHAGEKYLPGQAVKVISFQQCDDIPVGEERVLETVKPTIYRDGVVVKQGEVVIGTPITNQQNEGNKP